MVRVILLEMAVVAARAKATVGEITDAMEAVFGRHVAETRAISGVYGSEMGENSESIDRVRTRIAEFTG